MHIEKNVTYPIDVVNREKKNDRKIDLKLKKLTLTCPDISTQLSTVEKQQEKSRSPVTPERQVGIKPQLKNSSNSRDKKVVSD